MKYTILLLGILASVRCDSPIVESSLGKISGKYETILDQETEQFLGLPYAKPPVNELRFAMPVPFGHIGNFDASRISAICPQRNSHLREMNEQSEDCLHLNIYRRKGVQKGDKKPVLALIHGGAFIMGSAVSSYMTPKYLTGVSDMVVVAFNYRLNVFGFAQIEGLAPGNLGLRDQRLALEWIQDNIADFGGDPNRVTLMGVSAGSMSAAAQIITPIDSKKLFHAVIMDAGTLASYGFIEDREDSHNRTRDLATKLGCPVDASEMLDCLRKTAVEEFFRIDNNQLLRFKPTMDDEFIPRDVEQYVEKHGDKLPQIPAIIGYAKDEGTLFISLDILNPSFPELKTRNEIIDYLKKVAEVNDYPIDFSKDNVRELIGKLYVDEHNGNPVAATADFQGDIIFKCPINDFIKAYSKQNDKVYAYYFERKLRKTFDEKLDINKLGVFHYSPYVHFTGLSLATPLGVDPVDKSFILDSMQMISEFVETAKAPVFRGIQWPSFSKANEVFGFDETPSVKKGLQREDSCKLVFEGTDRSRKSKYEL